MDEIGRPPLDPDLYESLDSQLHEIDKLFWKELQNLQVEKTLAFLTGTSGPTPPKLPRKLRNILDSYATSLFVAEANAYPSDDLRLEHWLKGLAERTEQRVNGVVAALEKFAFLRSLEHHGLMESQRCEIVHESVQLSIESCLGKAATEESPTEAQEDNPQNWSPLRRNFEARKHIENLVSGPHEQIPEELVRRTIAEQLGIKPEEVTEEQIRFEVSGLLSIYPAITVIRSGPPEPILHPDNGRAETVNSRLPSTIDCPSAARKMEAYLSANGIGLTDFSSRAGTTDRTLRNFRKTGKIRRNLFAGIAKAMGITKEELLKS